MMMKHESEHYESEPKHIEKDLFKKAVITKRFTISLNALIRIVGCIKKKVIELQRAIIRELLGV